MLREEINTALKEAMKARDERRVSTLRLVSAAIKNAEIDAQLHGRGSIGEDEVIGLMQRMIKQRQEALEIYDRAGRPELADRERGEIAIIQVFLPKQMSEAEMQAAIADAVQATGAQSLRDMGKVMSALKQTYAGKLDFAKASGLVKGILAR